MKPAGRVAGAPTPELEAVRSALRAGDEEGAVRRLLSAAKDELAAERALPLAIEARSVDRNDIALQLLRGGGPPVELIRLQLRQELGEAVGDDVLALVGDSPPPGNDVLQAAGALIAEDRADQAEKLLAEVVARNPDWIVGHQQLTQVRWQRGDGARAHRSFQEGIAAHRAHELLWGAWLGSIKSMEGWDSFSRVATEARQLFPQSMLIEMVRADGLSEMGRFAEAHAGFQRLAQVQDASFDGARLRHAMRRRRYDEAIEIGSRAVSAHGHGECWAWLGAALRLSDHPRADWFYRGDSLIETTHLEFGPGELPALAAVLKTLHRGSSHPLGQSPRGGTQTGGPLFKRGEPEIGRLRQKLRAATGRYLTKLPKGDAAHPVLARIRPGFRFEGAWSVWLRPAGRHVAHIHSHGLVSSALYVDVPAGLAGDGAAKPGWLELGVPPLPQDNPVAPLAAIAPTSGRLVLFPSIFWHGTRPFAEGDRLTVAFDVVSR